MSQPSISSKKRLLFIFIVVNVVMFSLIVRLGWIQIVNGERYKELANAQQTRDIPIPAKRGIIYDRNGKELAISASSNTVYAKPSEIEDVDKTAKELSVILGLDEEKLKTDLTKKSYIVTLIRWIDDDLALKVRQAKLKGVWIADDNKRYYPYGNFASYIIGHITNDNRGMAGIELEYDKYLSGLPGRWIKNTDGAGRQLPFSVERYHPPEDGLSVVLTIDEVIQHFAEKAVQNALEVNQALRVSATVMDVKTGEILAMAIKPDYDPNEPRVPLDEALRAQLEELTDDEKLNEWYAMWRNPVINDTYEPGSTFKLVTTSAALEEGVATPQSTFYSSGTINVAGRIIKSWRWYNPFGHQTLTEAVQNSDNPVFVELAQRLGAETFHKYINAFGFSNTTGIDLPGERSAIMYSVPQTGPVELATMSFGQSISVTQLQLLTAVAAIANDGKLMQPRLVKELIDQEGKVIHQFEETFIRQVISEKTSKEMLEIMESVVSEGGGNSVYIPGYRIGGKTGTAQKAKDGGYPAGLYISSFIGVAPIDDPKLAILVVVDEPNGASHFGSTTAAPAAKEILEETLRYLDIQPSYNEEEAKELVKPKVTVPEVRDMSLSEASKILGQHNLQYDIETVNEEHQNDIVVDMFPKPGASVPEKSIILLYTRKGTDSASVTVPDLTGKTIREANTILSNLGLRLKITGSGQATKQYPEMNEQVEAGTIVSVEFN
ncbi:penicillin-binding transpeptidase domain-containing protein [Alkaliphilus crotonatoxidans]